MIQMSEMQELERLPNESEHDYRMRCYLFKRTHPHISWSQMAHIMNDKLNHNYSHKAYYKQYRNWFSNDCEPEVKNIEEAAVTDNTSEDNYIYDLSEEIC